MNELRLAGGDRKRGDERAIGDRARGSYGIDGIFGDDQSHRGGFVDAELVAFGIDDHMTWGLRFIALVLDAGDFFDEKRFDVRDKDFLAGAECLDFRCAIDFNQEIDIGVVAFRHQFADTAIGESFGLGLFDAILRELRVHPFFRERWHRCHDEW